MSIETTHISETKQVACMLRSIAEALDGGVEAEAVKLTEVRNVFKPSGKPRVADYHGTTEGHHLLLLKIPVGDDEDLRDFGNFASAALQWLQPKDLQLQKINQAN